MVGTASTVGSLPADAMVIEKLMAFGLPQIGVAASGAFGFLMNSIQETPAATTLTESQVITVKDIATIVAAAAVN